MVAIHRVTVLGLAVGGNVPICSITVRADRIGGMAIRGRIDSSATCPLRA